VNDFVQCQTVNDLNIVSGAEKEAVVYVSTGKLQNRFHLEPFGNVNKCNLKSVFRSVS
jgi:hypothetical protein